MQPEYQPLSLSEIDVAVRLARHAARCGELAIAEAEGRQLPPGATFELNKDMRELRLWIGQTSEREPTEKIDFLSVLPIMRKSIALGALLFNSRAGELEPAITSVVRHLPEDVQWLQEGEGDLDEFTRYRQEVEFTQALDKVRQRSTLDAKQLRRFGEVARPVAIRVAVEQVNAMAAHLEESGADALAGFFGDMTSALIRLASIRDSAKEGPEPEAKLHLLRTMTDYVVYLAQRMYLVAIEETLNEWHGLWQARVIEWSHLELLKAFPSSLDEELKTSEVTELVRFP